MTRAEALAEARRRFGKHAWTGCGYTIGVVRMPETDFPLIPGESPDLLLGSGNSWEAAFADADRRAAR